VYVLGQQGRGIVYVLGMQMSGIVYIKGKYRVRKRDIVYLLGVSCT